MTHTEELDEALSNLQSSSGDIEACAVVSEDGLIMASSIPNKLEEGDISAISAAMHSTGIKVATELKRGDLEQVLVKGENGYVIIMNASPNAVLLTMARKEAKLGLVFFDLSRTVEDIKIILA